MAVFWYQILLSPIYWYIHFQVHMILLYLATPVLHRRCFCMRYIPYTGKHLQRKNLHAERKMIIRSKTFTVASCTLILLIDKAMFAGKDFRMSVHCENHKRFPSQIFPYTVYVYNYMCIYIYIYVYVYQFVTILTYT